MKIAGCDCGKSSLDVAVLTEMPTDLKEAARKHRPLKITAEQAGVDRLLSLADIYAIEPTGNYSRLWIEILQGAGKVVKLVSPNRVKALMRMCGVTNKSDRLDCYGIAAYTLLNRHNDKAFLSFNQQALRDLYHDRARLVTASTRLKNQIGNRLTFELPEWGATWERKYREWGAPPTGMFLDVGGLECNKDDRYQKKRARQAASSIGSGLSDHTRGLGRQLVEIIQQIADLENGITAELTQPEYQPYRQIFKRFELYPLAEAVILGTIYPFERFLDSNGKRIIEYTPTKRDRSEGGFKLSLGMGKVLHQSGGIERWKAGGSKLARTVIWQYIKTIVIIHKGNSSEMQATAKSLGVEVNDQPWLHGELCQAIAILQETTVEIASLRLHFEFAPAGKKGDRRVSATAGRFTRMLYKTLLREFSN
jgi:hypothetical protein